MWIYEQATGRMSRNGILLSIGYSGAQPRVNDPTAEAIRMVGPIPRGKWVIGPLLAQHPTTGPYVLRLSPQGHKAHGRSGFLIHGDNQRRNQTASHGCIILPRTARVAIWESGDRLLEVV